MSSCGGGGHSAGTSRKDGWFPSCALRGRVRSCAVEESGPEKRLVSWVADERPVPEEPGGSEPGGATRVIATFWITVFAELLATHEHVRSTLEDALETMSEDARQEVLANDLPLLDHLLTHYEDRLAYWRRRESELERGAS